MLASRRHKSAPKSCHLSRATSTLKHSSNQKGFLTRNRSRNPAAATVSKTRVNTEARVQSTARARARPELPASWLTVFAEIFAGSMLDLGTEVGNPNDIMLGLAVR